MAAVRVAAFAAGRDILLNRTLRAYIGVVVRGQERREERGRNDSGGVREAGDQRQLLTHNTGRLSAVRRV